MASERSDQVSPNPKTAKGDMRVSRREPSQISLTYFYDPIPLDKVALDAMKDHFASVQSFPDWEMVFVESTEQKKSAHILSARLDYTDEATGEFEARNLDLVRVLFKALPPVAVKSLGVALVLKVVVEGEKDAGIYATEHFVQMPARLADKLGARIIASATRITYGEPRNFFDLRITPSDIGDEVLHLQLRKQKTADLADGDRIYDETVTAYKETSTEMTRLLELL